jgi:D-alanyl-D-alanine carboxypeptidase/D-alanyl-D-alanine-endopeptidase (penicillin-binding protein 4)
MRFLAVGEPFKNDRAQLKGNDVMMQLMRCSVVAIAALLLAAGARGADGLESRVEAVLKSPGYDHGQWGILVVDRKSGEVVYERNADSLYCPASVTKLYSTAAAWLDLGPNHRFRTTVRRKGEVDGQGVLRGDLILVASGDMTLGGRMSPDGTMLFANNDHTYSAGGFSSTLVPCNPLAGLEALASQVRKAGIKAVAGDVLVDDRLFEVSASTGSGPSRVSPIVVNDNVIDVVVTPGSKAGEPARATSTPETAYAMADVQVDTVGSDQRPSLSVESLGGRRFVVRGRLPVGHKPVVRIYEVDDPASYARTLFIEALRRNGVDVSASLLAENRAEALPTRSEVGSLSRVAEFVSPPFHEYAKVILKVSLNLHASTLPLLLAANHAERSLGAGLRRQAARLKELNVDVKTISFGGGAGGSRADLVTPRATVALLRAMTSRPRFPEFEAALPVLGVDGTLAKSVKPESPARGHARAKTGTYWVEDSLEGKPILTSKALAGYLDTKSGRALVFAFFVNNVPLEAPHGDVSEATAGAGRVLGRLCEAFYDDSASLNKAAARAEARPVTR